MKVEDMLTGKFLTPGDIESLKLLNSGVVKPVDPKPFQDYCDRMFKWITGECPGDITLARAVQVGCVRLQADIRERKRGDLEPIYMCKALWLALIRISEREGGARPAFLLDGQPDKALHFIYGAYIASGFQQEGYAWDEARFKEESDVRRGSGQYSLGDLCATAMGIDWVVQSIGGGDRWISSWASGKYSTDRLFIPKMQDPPPGRMATPHQEMLARNSANFVIRKCLDQDIPREKVDEFFAGLQEKLE